MKWLIRRKLATKWERLLVATASLQSKDTPEAHQMTKEFSEACMETMGLYPANHINKGTLRAMTFQKRILADKGLYEHVKVIEYLTAGHNASRKFKGDVRDITIAHFWNLAATYCNIIATGRSSNPMIPGELLNPKVK